MIVKIGNRKLQKVRGAFVLNMPIYAVRTLGLRPGDVMSVSITDGGARESVILIEIARAEENSKTGHRWYDRVKKSVEYIGRNWGPIVFILDRLCGK
jgi:hypothetical protein